MDQPEDRLRTAGVVALAAFGAVVVFALVYGPVSWILSGLGASPAIASLFGIVAGFFSGRALFLWVRARST